MCSAAGDVNWRSIAPLLVRHMRGLRIRRHAKKWFAAVPDAKVRLIDRI